MLEDIFEKTENLDYFNYIIKPIDSKIANNMVKKYHYSGKTVKGTQIHLGVYHDDRGLCGVLQYGRATNGDKTYSKLSNNINAMELNRMIMLPTENKNAESAAISKSIKWLKNYRKDVDWLLSFSDGKEGNVGYIYQASNWKYLGFIMSDAFWELDGEIKHNITCWHHYKKKHVDKKKTTIDIIRERHQNVSRLTTKQHVYVYPLKRKILFSIKDVSQFPKKEKEKTILKTAIFKRDGVNCNDVMIHYTQEDIKDAISWK